MLQATERSQVVTNPAVDGRLAPSASTTGIMPVVLCGGVGSRLWPLSREAYPKQFLPLAGERTMLQLTLERLGGLKPRSPLVVANSEHRFLVAEQIRQLGIDPSAIVLEPVGRNTAPAVAVAALQALQSDPDAVLLVLPADHVLADVDAFHKAVAAGSEAAADGALVAFGIVPTAPETGYGYIQLDGEQPFSGAYRIRRFVEKPDGETAKRFLASGDHLWNSGMFLFRADRYLSELETHAPEILSACRTAHAGVRQDLDFLRLEETAFSASPATSIDYAVMEKTSEAVVVPLDAGWNDIGSWSALREVRPRDGDGNVTIGDVWMVDTRDSYVHAQERMVATVGLNNHVVIETADAVLVAPCDRAQDVKAVVERLRLAGRDETNNHRRVYRPWGSYEGITKASRYQVKHIVVKPGESLSLQMHHHRAEHWIVVSGTAKVVCGEQELLLSEDQSTYIPIGTVHRLENPGVIPLELIEVQSGSYLGEDDIIRLEDQYGRH